MAKYYYICLLFVECECVHQQCSHGDQWTTFRSQFFHHMGTGVQTLSAEPSHWPNMTQFYYPSDLNSLLFL